MEIRVPKSKSFRVLLTGEQIGMLLELIRTHTFSGAEVFAIGNLIGALQKPVLDDAHNAVPVEEEISAS